MTSGKRAFLVAAALWAVAGTALGQVAAGNGGAVPPPRPPSPFGEGDTHGVYERESECWLWDPSPPREVPGSPLRVFSTEQKCAGKPLEGEAALSWSSIGHAGETWRGQFHNGRLTGTVTHRYNDATSEVHYVDGLRDGASFFRFNDGGSLTQNFTAGLQDGEEVNLFAGGGKTEGRFEKGRRVGVMTQTFPDGSAYEYPAPPPQATSLTPGTRITADGARLPGVYAPAHADMAHSPPVFYPPISRRLDEQGTVQLFAKISADGAVQEVKLARSSGWMRLDASALQQLATFHFFPATLDGKPIDTVILITQRFNLSPAE